MPIELQNILNEEKDGILYVTINRPDKLNALNRKTIEELDSVFTFADQLDTVRAVILTGSGNKAFVAGADISEFSSFTDEEAMNLSLFGQAVFSKIESLRKPVIAAVNGYALGGGCELALACHLRIASQNAVFGLPEVTLGLLPGYGGTQRLPLIIGRGQALEMILTGSPKDSTWALQTGLVNHVTESENLLAKATEIAKVLSTRGPIAMRKAIEATLDPIVDYRLEAKLFGDCFDTADFREGTSAFLEKRKPVFQGK
ncbi:MAG: enoyl-CoA hydratase [Chitinophagaceae bacterium]|nr:enoyl-CoA hydratase [Chitinophagaceae bacterium]